MNDGFFIVSELEGLPREQVEEVQRASDPRLAASSAPHITIVGSSGVGPIPLGTPVQEIRAALEPIAADIAPIMMEFGPAMRFMQTDIIVLPLDPHGPLRTLHERIARSGLRFSQARFTFTPHCTLSFYPLLSRDAERRLLSVRVTEPVLVHTLKVYRSVHPMPYTLTLELPLDGAPAGRTSE